MMCPRCEAICTPEDNYCYRCGVPLKARPLPAVHPSSSITPMRQAMAPVLARGMAYVLLGILGHWAARKAADAMARWALRALMGPRAPLPTTRGRAMAPSPKVRPHDHTIVLWRWFFEMEERKRG